MHVKKCACCADEGGVEAAGVRAAWGSRPLGAAAAGLRFRLGALVLVSFVLRAFVFGGSATPRYYPDEYVYSALGRSLGQRGNLQVHGGSVHLTALLEPLLAAPLWALSSIGTAYRLVQVENALFMSLAAIPTYLIARRLCLSQRYALLCAAFAVATPDLVLSRYVMADPVAYPLVLASFYAGLVALDRPSRRAELAFLGLAALTVAARVQYVVLFLAFCAAAVALERRRAIRVHLGLAVVLAVASVTGLALGRQRVLGYYSSVLDMHVGVATLRWAAVDLFLLALASGVVLVPGALAAVLRPQGRTETSFSLLSLGFGAALLGQAALFASNGGDRFEERYLFALLPLVPIAFGLYLRRGRPAHVPLFLVAAGLVVTLARVPLSGYTIGVGNNDSPFLYAVSELERRIGLGNASLAIALAGSAAAVLGALPRLRLRAGVLVTVALVLVSLASVGATAYDRYYADAVRAEYVAPNPSWIDALGVQDVTAIQTPGAPPRDLLDQFFWNRSLTRELVLGDAQPSDAAPAPRVWIGNDGTLRTSTGMLRSPLLWQGAAASATFSGVSLAASEKTFDLWRPRGVPRLRVLETGRYRDGWLAWNGRITVWPDASGFTHGTVLFTLSLPPGKTPVEFRIAGRHEQVRPGQRMTLHLKVDGAGPVTLPFTTIGGSVGRGLRPLSVRSTMPGFLRSKRTVPTQSDPAIAPMKRGLKPSPLPADR
jgi:hypothetical protein